MQQDLRTEKAGEWTAYASGSGGCGGLERAGWVQQMRAGWVGAADVSGAGAGRTGVGF
jgi:hypothetical protein